MTASLLMDGFCAKLDAKAFDSVLFSDLRQTINSSHSEWNGARGILSALSMARGEVFY